MGSETPNSENEGGRSHRRVLFAAAVVAFAPTVLDLGLRSARIFQFSSKELAFYVSFAVLSAGFWFGLIVAGTSRSRFRHLAFSLGAFALLFLAGAQLYTFQKYHIFLDPQAILVGTSMLPSVKQQLASDWARFAILLGAPLSFGVIALTLLRRRAGHGLHHSHGRAGFLLAAFSLGLAMAAPIQKAADQGAPFDMLYASAFARLLHAQATHKVDVERLHPEARRPETIAYIEKKKSAPNVLLIVTESVRSTSTCNGPVKEVPCRHTPYTDELLKDRFVFRNVRSLASTTAISLGVLWTGLAPYSSREDFHSMPLLWEYAHTAGFDTAYFTSQNLMFGNSGRWLEGIPVSKFVSATTIDPYASLEVGADDEALMNRALDDMGTLKEPYFSVVHLSNTHFEYKLDDTLHPFSDELGYTMAARYQDSIVLQDSRVAKFLKALRQRDAGQRTVVLFVSDHGEQINERGQIGHTFSLYDEEIRVPFWIDPGEAPLSEEQRKKLRSLEETPLFQTDVFPTVLDLLGVLDESAIAPFRSRYAGTSLLRGGSAPGRIVELSNCSPLWMCAYKNWGVMAWPRKLFAQPWDRDWKCFDLEKDPGETTPIACDDLRAIAETRGRPFH